MNSLCFDGKLAPLVLAGPWLAACRSEPIVSLPAPPPPVEEWTTGAANGPDAADDSGAFLGVDTEEHGSGGLDDLEFLPGVRVRSVARNSPAEAAGVRAGDVVLAFGGESFDDPQTLSALLAQRAPGAQVELKVQRGDGVFQVPVLLAATSGASAEPATRLATADPTRTAGWWFTAQGGVRLVRSDEHGPFARAGVPDGALVLAIDGERVLSDRALLRELRAREPGARVRVTWRDDAGSERESRVRLLEEPRKVTGFGVPFLVSYDADARGARTEFELVDLWLLSLFRYERDGLEKKWSVLRFLRFSTGAGELGE